MNYRSSSFECKGCSNLCEIVEIRLEKELLARWGGRCGKWDTRLPCGLAPRSCRSGAVPHGGLGVPKFLSTYTLGIST